MAYTNINFKSKKDLKESVASGKKISCYSPAGLGEIPLNGTVFLEGPHYPQPHKWYAQAQLKDGYITSVK